jgi:hypothetical protein
MKLYIKTILFIVLFPINLWGQIGVNTETPLGILHIDTKSNNTSSLSNKYEDDIVIDASGNIGLGTERPTAKLDVRGQVLIDDGTQVPNYLLTTDGTGMMQWKPKISNRSGIWRIGSGTPFTFTETAKRLTGYLNIIYPDDEIGLATGSNNSVIVPAGKYLVFFFGDIAGSEYGTLYLRTSTGTDLHAITYNEFLAGSSCELLLSSDTELHLAYSHKATWVSFYNGYNTTSYNATYYMQLSFLQLK